MLSPLKKFIPPHRREAVKKPVVQNLQKALAAAPHGISREQEGHAVGDQTTNSNMVVDSAVGDEIQKSLEEENKKNTRRFKRVLREGSSGKKVEVNETLIGKKRSAEEEDLEEPKGEKKRREEDVVEKESATSDDAGLADQSCNKQ